MTIRADRTQNERPAALGALSDEGVPTAEHVAYVPDPDVAYFTADSDDVQEAIEALDSQFGTGLSEVVYINTDDVTPALEVFHGTYLTFAFLVDIISQADIAIKDLQDRVDALEA